MTVHTIDCQYIDEPKVAAAYLIREGDELAFVETNTAQALPHLLAAIKAQGLTAEAVRYIIITHVHLDHAGGAGPLMAACPNATLLAHPKAAPHAIDPSKLIQSAEQVYGAERFQALYGTLMPVPADRVRVMEDEDTLVWGTRTLTFLHTRGHANHHFVIHDSRENGVFTGDAFGVGYPAVQGSGTWLFPSTSPTDFDAKAAIASVRRIVDTGADRVWLTHFGEVTDLATAADQLIDHLRRYGVLVDTADASNLQGQALVDLCAKTINRWFDAELTSRGLQDNLYACELLTLDRDLNAQGVAFAVQKRRYKRERVQRRPA